MADPRLLRDSPLKRAVNGSGSARKGTTGWREGGHNRSGDVQKGHAHWGDVSEAKGMDI